MGEVWGWGVELGMVSGRLEKIFNVCVWWKLEGKMGTEQERFAQMSSVCHSVPPSAGAAFTGFTSSRLIDLHVLPAQQSPGTLCCHRSWISEGCMKVMFNYSFYAIEIRVNGCVYHSVNYTASTQPTCSGCLTCIQGSIVGLRMQLCGRALASTPVQQKVNKKGRREKGRGRGGGWRGRKRRSITKTNWPSFVIFLFLIIHIFE